MFLTRLDISEGEGGDLWLLDAPLVWEGPWPGGGTRRFEVPAGFVTDLDSVPRLPVVYLLLKGRARAAAVLHDWLYYDGLVGRAEADTFFFKAMAATGVGWWRRWLIWAGVRLGGRAAFDSYRRIRELAR